MLLFEKKVLDDLKFCPNVVQCYGEEITEGESGECVHIICFWGTILDTYKIVLPSLDLMACRNQKFTNIQEVLYMELPFIHS